MGSAITIVLSDYENNDSTSATTVAPLTYFVCGAARGDDDEPPKLLRGDELVEDIRFKDDVRTVPSTQLYSFNDGTGASATDASARDTLSSEVLTRGGYREHTDGNRVSTTRGDSVDVVYGNYKLVVLGRITSSFDPSGRGGLGETRNSNSTLAHTSLDASGGLLTDETSTGGRIVSASWDAETEGGSWCTLEQTDSGDRRVVYRGQFQRTFHGPKLALYIGEGTSAVSIDAGNDTASAHAAERPAVKRSTFARAISHQERYVSRSESVEAKNIEERLEVADKAIRAEVWRKRGELLAACATREEIAADHVSRSVSFGTTRFTGEIGGVRADTHALGYHQTLRSGSRMHLWLKGIDARADAPHDTSLKIGMDSAYRFCPSVDFTQSASMRVHFTLDVLLPINKLISRLFSKRAYVLDGETVVIKVQNSSCSSTV
ncbi:MAG: hypothetical protein U0414_21280 [Polyangiaceae bacterium]